MSKTTELKTAHDAALAEIAAHTAAVGVSRANWLAALADLDRAEKARVGGLADALLIPGGKPKGKTPPTQKETPGAPQREIDREKEWRAVHGEMKLRLSAMKRKTAQLRVELRDAELAEGREAADATSTEIERLKALIVSHEQRLVALSGQANGLGSDREKALGEAHVIQWLRGRPSEIRAAAAQTPVNETELEQVLQAWETGTIPTNSHLGRLFAADCGVFYHVETGRVLQSDILQTSTRPDGQGVVTHHGATLHAHDFIPGKVQQELLKRLA